MRFIFTFIGFILFTNTFSQRCATPDYILANPIKKEFKKTYNQRPFTNKDLLKDEIIVIPVVVHVLFNNADQNISDDQVKSQIDALNRDYRRLNTDAKNTPAPFKGVAADTKIVFCLAKIDPNGNPTTGIIHQFTKESLFQADDQMKFSAKGGSDAWDASKYLNLWVCNLFGRTLGYSVIPGSPADRDGVVIKYNVFGTIGKLTAPYNKGRTATHEIGHWLGLKHLWGDTNCGDDGIDDTPPQQAANNNIPGFPHTSSCSINSYGDMFMNFMDFTDDACMNMFTEGQKDLMRSQFAEGNPRYALLSSNVCDGEEPVVAPEEGPTDVDATSPTISTFPNPFTNEIIVDSKNTVDLIGKVVKLYDMNGKMILTQHLQSQRTTLYIHNVTPGLYLLKIEGGNKKYIFKLIKQ